MQVTIKVEDVLNFIYLIYDALRNGIKFILEETIIKASPELASKYADAISILITITAVWIIIEFSSALKKIFQVVVILGWILLFLSIAISLFF